jgi:Golgi-resident PAP phosphatase
LKLPQHFRLFQDHDSVKSPVVIVSRSHAGEVEKLAQKMFGTVKIIPAAGAGYKIIQVLTGNATIYLHNTRIKKWDLCAGDAIVKSVNGRMVTLKGEGINYDSGTNHVVEDGLLVELNKNNVI